MKNMHVARVPTPLSNRFQTLAACFQFAPESGIIDRMSNWLGRRQIDQIIQKKQFLQNALWLNPLQRAYLKALKAHFGVARQIQLVEPGKGRIEPGNSKGLSRFGSSRTRGSLISYGCSWPESYPVYLEIRSQRILQNLKGGSEGCALLPEIALELAQIESRAKPTLLAMLDLSVRIAALSIAILAGLELAAHWGAPWGACAGIAIAAFGGNWLSSCAMGKCAQRDGQMARSRVDRLKMPAHIPAKTPFAPICNNDAQADGTPICPIALGPIPIKERAYFVHFNQRGYPLVTVYSRREITRWLAYKPLDPQTSKTLHTLLDFQGRAFFRAPFSALMSSTESFQTSSDQIDLYPRGFECVPLKDRVFALHFDREHRPLITMYRQKKGQETNCQAFDELHHFQMLGASSTYLDYRGRIIARSALALD